MVAEMTITSLTSLTATRAVLAVILSTVFFSSMHGAIRHLSADLHPFVIAFFRNVFGLLVIVPWFVRDGIGLLKTSKMGLHAARALVNTAAMLTFFYSLSITPLTTVTALAFSAPIFATVLAMLVFREAVGWRRWTAILVGFVGCLIVLRPGFVDVGLGPILVLIAAFAWATVLSIIKVLGRTESSVTITAYMSLLMAPLSLIPALLFWQTPSGDQVLWLIGLGIAGGLGQLLMAEALRLGDTSLVMPFDFFKLVWATLIAWTFFRESPDLYTWIGGAVIFASTLYIAMRERHNGAASPATPATAIKG